MYRNRLVHQFLYTSNCQSSPPTHGSINWNTASVFDLLFSFEPLQCTMGDSQDSDEDLLSLPDPEVSAPRSQWAAQLSSLPPRLLNSLMSFQKEGVEFALSRNGR